MDALSAIAKVYLMHLDSMKMDALRPLFFLSLAFFPLLFKNFNRKGIIMY
jgi:hypothetical protein